MIGIGLANKRFCTDKIGIGHCRYQNLTFIRKAGIKDWYVRAVGIHMAQAVGIHVTRTVSRHLTEMIGIYVA